jgi:hypothetical protein
MSIKMVFRWIYPHLLMPLFHRLNKKINRNPSLVNKWVCKEFQIIRIRKYLKYRGHHQPNRWWKAANSQAWTTHQRNWVRMKAFFQIEKSLWDHQVGKLLLLTILITKASYNLIRQESWFHQIKWPIRTSTTRRLNLIFRYSMIHKDLNLKHERQYSNLNWN